MDWTNPITPFLPGADFAYRQLSNELLEIEWEGGNSEMTKEEYREGLFPRGQLRPRSGRRVFTARMVGTGYTRSLDG
jgi:hypothetical protein